MLKFEGGILQRSMWISVILPRYGMGLYWSQDGYSITHKFSMFSFLLQKCINASIQKAESTKCMYQSLHLVE